jgi:hypothetical protein
MSFLVRPVLLALFVLIVFLISHVLLVLIVLLFYFVLVVLLILFVLLMVYPKQPHTHHNIEPWNLMFMLQSFKV